MGPSSMQGAQEINTTQPGEITLEFQGVKQALDVLKEQILLLRKRLEPVMNMGDKVEKDLVPTPGITTLSTMGKLIQAMKDDINGKTEELRDITDRIVL